MCGRSPDPRIEFTEQVNKDLATAYQPSHNETAGWDAIWQLDQQSVDVAWLAPATHERLPLIIYLPGLGESASAERSGARLGRKPVYAVLSVSGARL